MRLARLPGGLALGALRIARPHCRAAAVDGLRSGRTANEVVAVAAEPVLDLRAARFSAEDDSGGPDPAAVVLLEHAHPQMAVEEDGESRRHCASRYAEADLVTPDSSTERGDGHGRGAARTSYRAVRFAHQELMGRFYRRRRSAVAHASTRPG